MQSLMEELGSHIGKPRQEVENKKEYWQQLALKLRSIQFKNERMPLRLAAASVCQKLDLSFLSMAHKKCFEDYELYLPRFGVFMMEGKCFEDFEIHIQRYDVCPIVRCSVFRITFPNIPTCCKKHLAEAFNSFFPDKNAKIEQKGSRFVTKILPSERRKIMVKMGLDHHESRRVFHTSFQSLIPSIINKRIFQTEGFWDRMGIITEASKWGSKVVPQEIDPFLVGLLNGDLYLIEAFDPTPLEEYVLQT